MTTHESLCPVGIVGLGLMGGSLARDLVARGRDVIAYDRHADRLRRIPDPVLARIHLVPVLADVVMAQTIVLAVPVATALSVLAELTPLIGSCHFVMDMGGTKASIVARAELLGIGGQFIGCHPLAGDHRSGWEASRDGLFVDAPVFICRPPSAGEHRVVAAEQFWEQLGARCVCTGADEHDARLAFTSHLPHMLAAALALALQREGVARGELGPGGRDMTRLSSGTPDIWNDIALDNAAALTKALTTVEETLASLRSAIHSRDAACVAKFLTRAREW